MISTVLYETNGVLTEDRFQKMTPHQWLFHYISILKNKKLDAEVENSRIKTILKMISIHGILVNKELGYEIYKANFEDKKELTSEEEDLLEFMKEVPEAYGVETDDPDSSDSGVKKVSLKDIIKKLEVYDKASEVSQDGAEPKS